MAGALALSGCDRAPDTADVDAEGVDLASAAADRLLEVFNAQDAEEVAGIFGDDVAFTLESGEDVIGADAANFWQGFFGVETGERITEPYHAPDGHTYFLTEFTRMAGGSTTLAFDVEMDGERLVSMGARPRNLIEIIATREIDSLYEAFNDQDLDRLTEEFGDMTYRSPSGVEVTGAEAAELWADAFGATVERTTGVFALDDDTNGFDAAYRDPETDVTTTYTVEVDVSGGQLTSMTERRPPA